MFVKLIGYADAAGNADGGRFAEVIHIYRGVYHLKMPNGCRGAMFFNKALLRTRVREGDMVTAIVIGFRENDDAVKCSLR